MEDDARHTLSLKSICRFQSTSPVWRTTAGVSREFITVLISIHVPRVEDDFGQIQKSLICLRRFQSTSPVWRTTPYWQKANQSRYISIHVPRVEDDRQRARSWYMSREFQSTSPVWRTTGRQNIYIRFKRISIHVPRVEDDGGDTYRDGGMSGNFNPRPPCGGRLRTAPAFLPYHDFNPRPPCGGRRTVRTFSMRRCTFQSTSPVWRTTIRYILF